MSNPIEEAIKTAIFYRVPGRDYLGTPYASSYSSDYNYFAAHPSNKPENLEEHWTSRNPVTGQLLKRSDHPTYDLMINGEKISGMETYTGLDGEQYSRPLKEGIKSPYRLTRDIDFSNIKTTNNRSYDPELISYINKKIDHLPDIQQAIILGNIIEESGGNPFAKSKDGTYHGLLQWADNRYRIPQNTTDKFKLIDEQLEYLLNSIGQLKDRVSWTHGGDGSKYQTGREAYNKFHDDDLWTAHRAFSYGYVRPLGKEDSAKNRYKVVQQIYDKLNHK